MSDLKLALGAGLAVVAGSSTLAQEGFTRLQSPPGAKASHGDILANALSETFPASGLDFANGSITAIRNLDHSGNDEGEGTGFFGQVWAARPYSATIVGHESAGSAEFGYVDDIGGGSNSARLLNVRDIGSPASATIGTDFRWAIQIVVKGIDPTFTSCESDTLGYDMMMSYTLMNENGLAFASVIFFEDMMIDSDWGFNDVAIPLSVIPTPQAASMGGLALLAGLGTTRRRLHA